MLMPGDSILNAGGSDGLMYPIISGSICGELVVWCRHCGIVFGWASSPSELDKLRRDLNGLTDEVDPGLLAELDAVP